MMSRRSIVISSGDPAGCGAQVTLRAIAELKSEKADFFVAGDKAIFQSLPVYQKVKNRISLIDLNTPGIRRIKKGEPSRLGGEAGLSYLDKALELMAEKKIKRLVTAPLSKEAVKLNNKQFSGHTEYLADYFRVKKFAMMMASVELKTVLLTRHIALKEVSSFLQKNDIYDSLCLVYRFLQRQFGIRRPKIVLCALNPHAGVNTFLGPEEKKLLGAKIKFGKPVQGPYPADTIFTKESLKQYDCIICPYHDQAMIPFKLLSFRRGVNVTLGLPIVRTSPAHGTAFDLIKTGRRPFHSSMTEAVKLALKLSP